MKFKEELEFGLQLLKIAQKEIMPYFLSDLKIEYKADHSPVTIADKKAEESMRANIEANLPGYGIIGEEFGSSADDKKYQWVIDPIDGTKSFICGVPLFSTLVALLEDNEPVIGLIGLPALNITVSAVKDQGCFINRVKSVVSGINSISKSVLLDGSTTNMEKMGLGEPWKNLRSRSRFHRGWGDAYGYYLIASGKAEVMVDPIAEIWDLAPMSVIIPEAGGKFTSLRGGDFIADRSGIASNGILHDEVIREFAPYF